MTNELATAPKESESKRQDNALGALTQEPASEQDGGFLSRAFGGSPGEWPADGAARFLSSPTLSHSANSGLRAISLKRTQQTFGNRFAQRAISGRFIQRQCSCGGTCEKCRAEEEPSALSLAESAEEPTRLVQRQAADSSTSATAESNGHGVIPAGSGEPLDQATHKFMASRFGTDFSDVRVHADSRAAQSADALGANAYTTGRDIYFAAGKYTPETAEGRRLLAHELTHTIQQGENALPGEADTTPAKGIVVGRADDPLEREAEQASEQVSSGAATTVPEAGTDSPGTIRPDLQDRASAAWEATGGKVVRSVGEEIESRVQVFIRGQFPTLEPYLHEPSRLWTNIVDAVGDGISTVVNALLSPVRDLHPLDAMRNLFTPLISAGATAFKTGDCAPFMAAIAQFKAKIGGLTEGPLNEVTQKVQRIRETISGAVHRITQPTEKLLEQFGGAVYKNIVKVAGDIGVLIGRLQSWGAAAVKWVNNKLGFGDSGAGRGGLWQTIKEKAAKAWEAAKEKLAPFVEPLKTAGMILLAVSPFGPILAAVKYGPRIVEWFSQVYEQLHVPEHIVSARAAVARAMPAIAQKLGQAALALTGIPLAIDGLRKMSGALHALSEPISRISILGVAGRALKFVATKIEEGVTWVGGPVKDATHRIETGIKDAGAWLDKVGQGAGKIIGLVLNPFGIVGFLAGEIWLAIPRCFKLPILNWILDLLIRLVQAMPPNPLLGPLFPLFLHAIIGFLKRVRGGNDSDEKVRVSDRLARLAAGSASFVLGLLWGIVKGVGEGLLMPFTLLYDLITAIPKIVDFVNSLPSRIVAAIGDIAQSVADAAQAAIDGFWPALRSALKSPGGGILDLLQKGWAALSRASEGVGGAVAGALIGFIMLSDWDLGEKLGWVAGTVLFEVALAYISGGASVLLKSASVPLRILGKILRVVVKAHEIMNKVFGLVFKALEPALVGIRTLVKELLPTLESKLGAIIKKFEGLIKSAEKAGEEFAGKFAGKEAGAAARGLEESGAALATGEGAATREAGETTADTAGAVAREKPPGEVGMPASDRPPARSAEEAPAGAAEQPRTADGTPVEGLGTQKGKAAESEAAATKARDEGAAASGKQEQISLQQADAEMGFLGDNPHLIEGKAPNRRAKIGEHEWRENPAGGWCRYSDIPTQCRLSGPPGITGATVDAAAIEQRLERMIDDYEDVFRNFPRFEEELERIRKLAFKDPAQAAAAAATLERDAQRLAGGEAPSLARLESTEGATAKADILEQGGREFTEKGFVDRAHHDIGVSRGQAKAADEGFRPVTWHNPAGHRGGYGQGFDDIMRDTSGNLVIVEFKGGGAELAKGQMTFDWVEKRITAIEPFNPELAAELRAALSKGQLTGRVYSTPLDINGLPAHTKVKTIAFVPGQKQLNPITPPIVQRECACGGTCEKCRATQADHAAVAEHVISIPLAESGYLFQRQSTAPSSAASIGSNGHGVIPPGNGEALDEPTRDFMESRFGMDFKDVRVHTDSQATASAEALNANAFTTGRDIYFAKGKYAPETVEGQRLMAHEFVHVTQQENAPSISHNSASTGSLLVDPDEALEHAADREADQILSPGTAASKSTRAARNETVSSPVAPRPVTPPLGQTPIQREAATAVAEPEFPSVRRETVPSEGASNSAAVREQMPGLGIIQPIPGATGEDPFNPGSIVNDLRRAIDQSEVAFAGYEAFDPFVPYTHKMKFHRKINFEAVYKALDNKSATEIKIVRDLYAVKEGKRSLDHDLFETGESGYPSDLTFIQRSRLQVLLRGTKADVLPPEIPEYLKRLKPEIAARLQWVIAESKLLAVRLNQLDRTALEIVQILSDDLDGLKREQLMALHRRPVGEISVIDAFYEGHTGVNLPSELSGKLKDLQLARMYQLREGNIPLADAFAIEDKRRAIQELDRVREANPIAGLALNIAVPGTEGKLDKERQKLVDQIDEIVALNRQEAMEAAAGTTTTAAQAVADRLKTVLGYGRDEAGRNVGDLLKVTLGEKKAAELTAITGGALIEAHARRLAESEARNATKPEHILAIIRELRAEASHDVVARAADPWLSMEEKKKLLDPDELEKAVQSQASAYVAEFQSAYENVRGEGRRWADIVEGFKDVDEDEVNRMAWSAGKLSDEEELDLAIRRNKPDLAIAILKRQPTQEDIQFLQMKYFSITGKWLETSLYGYRLGQAATAEEAELSGGGAFAMVGGIATGRQAALVAQQLAKPASKDRGGFVEMQWVAASAEREFEVTWENRGVTGRLREIGDDPETETIMRESIKEVRALKQRYLSTKDNLEQRRILAEMKRWRATLTGDAAAYEEDNKKMLDKIRSVVSIAVQLALAIALPGAGATFMGFVRATAMQIASSVASNVVIYGEDYSLDQLRTDIVGGLLGATGGKLGEEFVGAALAAKEARAAAGEIADAIAKPVADATASAAAKVGIGTTIAKEAASQLGSTAGQTLATGENQFTFENFFQGALMSGVGMVGKKVLGLDGPTPATQPRTPGGTHEGPAVAHPTERETAAGHSGDEPTKVTEGHERPAAASEVPHERKTTKSPTGDAALNASVEQSSHMDTISDQQAANEVAYIDKHPELPVEGTPPNQYVKLGDHQVVEVPTGGCERHSGGARKIGCPLRFLEELAEKPDLTEANIQALAEHLEVSVEDVKAEFARVARGRTVQESTVQERAAMAEGGGIDVESERMTITSPMVRRPPAPKVPKPPAEVPLSKIAEQQLRAPLERDFPGGTWEEQQRFKAPGAKPGETLGSTVPEYFRPTPPENMSFEVKRWDLDELGISPTGTSHAKPSASSGEALSRARQQLAARRENLPAGTTQCIVFNVTGLRPGITDRVVLGRQLRDVLAENHIHYDRVFVQDGDKLIPID